MDEVDDTRIRVFLNDPAGRGDRLVEIAAPQSTDSGPWAFRIEGSAPPPRPYEPDTTEFLYWQLASALDRGKRFWTRRLPGKGTWELGRVLPAVPVAGTGLNAFYDRKALRFFRAVDEKTGNVVFSGESPDISIHEEGHGVLDAIRPDLWDAPHFEVAAFHEGFGDLAAIFVALAEPVLDTDVVEATGGNPSRSNLVSRLAEELGAAVRDADGPSAALPGALRDAVNRFRYADPKTLPDSAPARELSAEPHSFCRILTGACWDAMVAIFRSTSGADRAAALSEAAETTARFCVTAAQTSPSGADFFGRVARRIVREAAGLGDDVATELAEAFFKRRLLVSPQVPPELAPDEDPGVPEPSEDEPPPATLVRAVEKRLPPETGHLSLFADRRPAADRAQPLRVVRGRRRRDLVLHGPEYGPANGAAVEISDGFALGFGEAGFLTASRMHPAGDRDAEDARAFVRHLARLGRIADAEADPPDSVALARRGQSHAVVREPDGVRRLRRIWIARAGAGPRRERA